MTETNRYELMMEVLSELAPEIQAARGTPRAARSSLSEVLQGFMPLPPDSIFLGVASDGLPVLLSLADAVPGPILIAGDAGSGKTALLQVIAKAVEECHEAGDVQYGVVTDKPEEWRVTAAASNRVGVFPTHTNEAEDFIRSLDDWAHANHNTRQSVLLLIDDLSSIMKLGTEARQSLRWLLLRGTSRRVWPMVTLNPKRVPDVHPWTSFFHTRLLGRIAGSQEIGDLVSGSRPRLEVLRAGNEFMLREGSSWLTFWIPSLD